MFLIFLQQPVVVWTADPDVHIRSNVSFQQRVDACQVLRRARFFGSGVSPVNRFTSVPVPCHVLVGDLGTKLSEPCGMTCLRGTGDPLGVAFCAAARVFVSPAIFVTSSTALLSRFYISLCGSIVDSVPAWSTSGSACECDPSGSQREDRPNASKTPRHIVTGWHDKIAPCHPQKTRKRRGQTVHRRHVTFHWDSESTTGTQVRERRRNDKCRSHKFCYCGFGRVKRTKAVAPGGLEKPLSERQARATKIGCNIGPGHVGERCVPELKTLH